ncbi:hypothetical protein C8Q80DRAFT_42565 [Daedaleopsis nitida]|nr:hypothetical protein C8Q80DRAFT_42565 [Daedaleopsis nitida]
MNASCIVQLFSAHYLLLVAANSFNDWKVSACPVPLMLEFLQSVVKFLFVGTASVLLALVGIFLSVIAYVKKSNRLNARRIEGAEKPNSVTNVRDARTNSPNHMPRARRASSTHPAPLQPIASTSQLPPLTLPLPSPGSPRARSSSPCLRWMHKKHRHVVSMPIAEETPSADTAIEAAQGSDVSSPVQHRRDPSPHTGQASRVSTSVDGDSSVGNRSAEPSEMSLSSQEQSCAPGRGVLQKIRGHRAQLREQCLNRAQSPPMPKTKPSRPARRTDPYQAPFFFPTPMSPQAGTYRQEVISERQGLSPPQGVFTASPPPSPMFIRQALLEPGSAMLSLDTPVVSSAVSPAEPEATVQPSRPPMKSHRWSWHNPLRPDASGPSVESAQPHGKPEKASLSEVKEGFRGFRFGHHRRRHGVGSDDSTARAQTLP